MLRETSTGKMAGRPSSGTSCLTSCAPTCQLTSSPSPCHRPSPMTSSRASASYMTWCMSTRRTNLRRRRRWVARPRHRSRLHLGRRSRLHLSREWCPSPLAHLLAHPPPRGRESSWRLLAHRLVLSPSLIMCMHVPGHHLVVGAAGTRGLTARRRLHWLLAGRRPGGVRICRGSRPAALCERWIARAQVVDLQASRQASGVQTDAAQCDLAAAVSAASARPDSAALCLLRPILDSTVSLRAVGELQDSPTHDGVTFF